MEIDNVGADWVRFDQIRIPGIGKLAEASGGLDGRYAIMRITRNPGSARFPIGISDLPFKDGTYWLDITDLDGGLTVHNGVKISNHKLMDPIITYSNDMVGVIHK